jgi:hypothetical protein
MTDDLCPHEGEVLRAADSGEWTPELRAHLVTCATCHEVEAVTQALRAAVEDEPVALRFSAEDIWWHAQFEARQQARASAMRPLDALERAEPLVALVGVATLLVLRGDALASRFMAWATSDATGQAVQALLPPALLPVLLAGGLLGGLVLLVGLGAVVASD